MTGRGARPVRHGAQAGGQHGKGGNFLRQAPVTDRVQPGGQFACFHGAQGRQPPGQKAYAANRARHGIGPQAAQIRVHQVHPPRCAAGYGQVLSLPGYAQIPGIGPRGRAEQDFACQGGKRGHAVRVAGQGAHPIAQHGQGVYPGRRGRVVQRLAVFPVTAEKTPLPGTVNPAPTGAQRFSRRADLFKLPVLKPHQSRFPIRHP